MLFFFSDNCMKSQNKTFFVTVFSIFDSGNSSQFKGEKAGDGERDSGPHSLSTVV